jgi:hypothetical protein
MVVTDLERQNQIYRSRRPRERSCDSMTDNSSCARFKPARPFRGCARYRFDAPPLRRASCALQIGHGVLARLWPRA